MSDTNKDLWNMSDEDFLETRPEDFPVETSDPQETVDITEETLDEASNEPEEAEVVDEGESEQEQDIVTEESELDDSTNENEESNESDEEEIETDVDEDNLDYQTEMEKLLSPFKANGTEIQVNNVDEAIKLMQMGANYSKKMSTLKPHLKMVKMLENNNLLSEDKLNLIIDVASGNKEAISKLVKDNGIDPLDLNTEENQYTPNDHTVGDHQVELDEVLSRIQNDTSFSDTMNVVTKQWDEASKRSIAAQPKLLEVINSHMSNGIYAKVSGEIARRRVFGELDNLSDLEAYKLVGDEMIASGKLEFGNPAPKKVIKTAPAKKQNDDKLKDKRKAASPQKSSAAKSLKEETISYLSMSDEEFEKQFNIN